VTGQPGIEAVAQVRDDGATVHLTRARLRAKYGLEFYLGRGFRRLRGQSFSRAVVLVLTVPVSAPEAQVRQTPGAPAR
jgi:hypothetical protein